MKAFNLASLIVTMVLLVGCSSSADTVRYYLIEPVSLADATNGGDTSIEIVDLEIPQYLERLQIASRRPDSQLVFASTHQWGKAFART